jgi:hypothetical protein
MFSLNYLYRGGIRTRVFCSGGGCNVHCATPPPVHCLCSLLKFLKTVYVIVRLFGVTVSIVIYGQNLDTAKTYFLIVSIRTFLRMPLRNFFFAFLLNPSEKSVAHNAILFRRIVLQKRK